MQYFDLFVFQNQYLHFGFFIKKKLKMIVSKIYELTAK